MEFFDPVQTQGQWSSILFIIILYLPTLTCVYTDFPSIVCMQFGKFQRRLAETKMSCIFVL